MNFRKAPWEKRNLDVNCCDIFIDNDDVIDDFRADIEALNEEYQVMHISGGNSAALLAAQNMGFQIIEMNVELVRDMKSVEIPTIYKRFEQHLSYEYTDEKTMEMVLDRVKKGDMFLTDKIASDPFFGPDKSGFRYYNWCKDIMDQGGVTVLSKYKNEVIGFETYKMDEKGSVTNIIGGVFPEYSNKGLGFAPLYVELLSQKEKGAKKVHTAVSSNNVPVLKVHEMLGYRVDKMTYILIRHL